MYVQTYHAIEVNARTPKVSIVLLKLRHYEQATKFEKSLPPLLTKQLFLLSSVKTSGRFFQNFVAFSEKLDFNTKIHISMALNWVKKRWQMS